MSKTTPLNAILASFGEIYVLVLGIYYKLQTFLYLSANGLIQGIRPLVGYNYGAGETKRVEKIYSVSMLLTAGFMLFGTVLCLIIPKQLMGLFTDNEETIIIGATAIRIISAGFALSSVSTVSCGALEGLGMGMPSLLISLCRYIIIIIPAAFVLTRFVGPSGVWNAFWVTELISAAAAWIIYHRKTRSV